MGLAIFVSWGVVQAIPYVQVVKDHPEARRAVPEVVALSPPRQSLLAAPERSLLWGGPLNRVRESLGSHAVDEKCLFPGLLTLALAGFGLASPRYGKKVRVALAIRGSRLGFSIAWAQRPLEH